LSGNKKVQAIKKVRIWLSEALDFNTIHLYSFVCRRKKRTIKQLFVNIWNNVHDWWMSFESRHMWITRLIVYFTCLAVVFLLCCILFCYFNLFHTDVNSARYMLSALVQSQAAIVAIVITLTLIAVQLTASAYSPRVIDIFKRNPDMWLLLGCYGVSIFYGFIVLKLVEGTEGEVVSQSAIWSLGPISISFECCVSLAYWLGAFTFVALFPYMRNVIGLLKSENIIKRLATELTKDKILNSKEDPIQPIMDVIHGSIMKYDLETTRVGLKAVTDQIIEIISSSDEKKILWRFCGHLERVSRLAISRGDMESTIKVIENFGKFGESTAEKGLENSAGKAAWSLEKIGRAAAEKGLEDATRLVAWSLEKIERAAAEKGLERATWQVAESLEEVGRAAAEKGLERATWQAAESLEEVGRAAAEKGLERATRQVAESLEEVGRAAAEKGLEDVTRQAAWSLEEVGRAAAEKGLERATWQAAESLAELTILSEEIIKDVIQNYESKLKKYDRDSFQKFKKLYEQKLEELRVEK